MEAGATLVAPETVWLSFDTVIGRDVTIEPNVFFGPGVVVEDGAHILANCHMVGARIGKGARVGPFARLRPGADIGRERAHRQLRRGQERHAGGGRQGQSPGLHRRRAGRARAPTSAPAPSSATTTASTSTSPTSARASSSAPTPRWWHRSRSATGAYIGSGSVITKNVEPDALALERATAGGAARAGRPSSGP